MPANAVTLTQELIRFDTVNPPGQERACAEHLGRLLQSAGFACTYVEMGEGRANLVARIGGAGDRLPIALTGHIDVVPLGTRPWTHAPFGGETHAGRVYGRGASDMKSGVAAIVAAAIDRASELAKGPGAVLIITAGEETGCTGAHHIVATARDLLGRAGALLVAEPTSNRPCVGHKGALRLKVTTTGATAHASMPEKGINAVYKAARAISRLESFDFNVARHGVMGGPTLNVGWVHGGQNINSVPDHAEVGVDIRTIPAQSHARIEEEIRSYLGAEATIAKLDEAVPVWTEPDVAWVRSVFDATANVTGEPSEVRAAPYFTDASALTPAYGGIPTVILGPGPPEMAHQTDEYAEVRRIEEAADICRRLLSSWKG